jgi:ATP-binding cassette subfamily C protein
MQKNWALPQLIYRIAGIVILVIVIYAGYKLEQIPLTSFFVLILLFSRIYPQITKLNNDVNVILSNVESVKLVMKLDEEFPDAALHGQPGIESLPLDTGISLENLKFSYPDREQLFEGFSEIIPAKKITGIIGESGRGKTTLIDLIAGLQKPDSGVIKVDDQVLDDIMLPRWKGSIGYLPQDPFFIDGSLRENLVWDSSHTISDEEIIEMLRKVNAVSLVERFSDGLDTPVMNYL